MRQTQEAKIGEVLFRQKLVNQHLGKDRLFFHESSAKQIRNILKERVASSHKIFQDLSRSKISLSPFLEVGAEKCQRSALLASKFNSTGFALDLSLESLKSAPFFAKNLGLKKVPNLICADAENLPFENNSFSFVFAFETLHHFPTPQKVLQEMRRVTADFGYVYFSEEPIKQDLNLKLWRRGYNLNSIEKILKKMLVLPFISKIGAAENQFGVLENEFSTKLWEKSLKDFIGASITIEPTFWGPKQKLINTGKRWPINLATRLTISIEGGGITVLYKKSGTEQRKKTKLTDLLRCPLCKKLNITRFKNKIICKFCRARYPIVNSVYVLIEPKLRKRLYPNLEK
ncbi:hypothetical protein A3D81_00595 [Candidatus Curtissbacteria bacterium RIFCSPHIGHO2_02_FULL_40_17]|uniref:Methyltransferase type 11 domain-containing protein n=4 Tax=Candidatus Curtissiibacteriota TaxID=1752717 RepID=A0A1F5GIE0_9BACT|nr:MAG: hypothetical protein A2693_01785 [Candidatus Curtissbacteria bacterium RIFCSPHIGHO2_01_FULL_40_12]OGD91594.1 MAG: hypothetical protein A3D81_00595 [Candidatus Curtissbacteria bacterium RIFCSPHIGHO2_02_FULL_40_17]OGE03439.1 MAG: hypothetical protein A3F45_04375 [Candidatus Curtissbacteria bacterium RIFCSPHIGHO2_12_FULL_41_17]OGE07898.1 MAG: hypothetical protein A3I53_04440 [Candidatus Curtissbacteria bacterium RIFCSPLOWO2_02_FULL_40_13b]